MRERLERAYSFMLQYQAAEGRPPTLAEIARAAGVRYRSSAAYIVRLLVLYGLARTVGGPRQSRRFLAVERK